MVSNRPLLCCVRFLFYYISFCLKKSHFVLSDHYISFCRIYIPVDERLQDIEKVKDIELGANQKQAIKDGKPVELTLDDTKVTVGIDLREPQGFKIVNGDLKEWERQLHIRYDNAHEDFMGYVMTDENRWEYQKVVERQAHPALQEYSEKKDRSQGFKL